MAISNTIHISEENKIRNLLEKIAEELNSQNIGSFFVRTSNYDGRILPENFDVEMSCIARKKGDEEEIVLGIHNKIIIGIDEKRHIMAYFLILTLTKRLKNTLKNTWKEGE